MTRFPSIIISTILQGSQGLYTWGGGKDGIKITNFKFVFIITRLTGRFAPILNLNCEHFLFVYFEQQKQIKVCEFSKEYSWISKILMQIEFCCRQICENLIIHKPSLGSHDVSHKIWAWSVQPFWRLLDIACYNIFKFE